MLIMAILMLNLLIAVLSTAHDVVIENAMTEFHLGRSQTIQASAHGIEKGRLPPPLNILMGVVLVAVDLVGEIRHQFRRSESSPDDKDGPAENNSSGGGGGGRAAPAFGSPGGEPKDGFKNGLAEGHSSGSGGGGGDGGDGGRSSGSGGGATPALEPAGSEPSKASFRPLSQGQDAVLLGGAMERLLFACIMGLVALALNAALWVVSILSLAGRIVRWMSVASETKRDAPPRPRGYFRQLFAGAVGVLAFAFGLFLAAFFCLFCIAGSIAAWFRGVYGLLEWYIAAKQMEPLSSFGKGAVMPGALGEDKEVWQHAVDTVEGNNFGPTERKRQDLRGFGGEVPRRFDVGALLNMTTGWSLGHLSALVSQKDEESRREEAILREIDEGKRRRGKARRLEETKYREDARMIRSVG